MRSTYGAHRVERNPLVLKPATTVIPTGAIAPADDTNVRDTRRPTNRGRLIPGLVTVILSAVINFLLIQAAVEYDKNVASPPPPPPPSPPPMSSGGVGGPTASASSTGGRLGGSAAARFTLELDPGPAAATDACSAAAGATVL